MLACSLALAPGGVSRDTALHLVVEDDVDDFLFFFFSLFFFFTGSDRLLKGTAARLARREM